MRVCLFGFGLLNIAGGLNQYFSNLARTLTTQYKDCSVTIVSNGSAPFEEDRISSICLGDENKTALGYLIFSCRAIWSIFFF